LGGQGKRLMEFTPTGDEQKGGLNRKQQGGGGRKIGPKYKESGGEVEPSKKDKE